MCAEKLDLTEVLIEIPDPEFLLDGNSFIHQKHQEIEYSVINLQEALETKTLTKGVLARSLSSQPHICIMCQKM